MTENLIEKSFKIINEIDSMGGAINAIENGVYVPSTVLALKISKTLNCNVEDLFQLPYLKKPNSQIDWAVLLYFNKDQIT